ncbi:MAG: SDR family oxidoreductase [Clostridia bacterium]|nr:SDR family oxidoreductase [Clostridia bacterium]
MSNTVLITGGSGGIGLCLAREFAANGNDIILVSSSEDRLMRAKAELERDYDVSVSYIAADLASHCGADELYRKVSETGKTVDVLVNNAGFGDYAEFVESDWAKQERMVTLNVTTLMHLCHLFGAEMKKRGEGRILNIASCAAFVPGPYMSVYYASKAFVLSFSEALYEELKEYGVCVTALCLGPTTTGFTSAADMGKCTMFKKIKPDTPEAVAKTGYKAVMKGKAVKYHGMPTKLTNLGSRLAPRFLTRISSKNINSKPE